ncbi:MAG: c-type cytochrome [Saprospiraceae bacterium]|nr:c-type cytochrome [Saprospiraceae bacterium]
MKFSKLIYTLFLSCCTIGVTVAQAVATSDIATTTKLGLDNIDILLLVIALFLLIPIYFASNAFVWSAKYFIEKSKNSSLVLLLITLSLSVISPIFAEGNTNSTTAAVSITNGVDWLKIAISFVILLELIVLGIITFQTKRFLNPTASATSLEAGATVKQNWFARTWNKMNNFVPISEEANLDTGHNYDGIRELNNVTPTWFTAAFVSSILFAFVYMYRYHVVKSAPLSIEEYEIEMEEASLKQAALMAKLANAVNEDNVKMLSGKDIKDGEAIFIQKCAVCHGAKGGSQPGGVGPNLTDEFWLHGGSLKDIFRTIKNGVPEKGMISWKDQVSPNQIAQISSFIKSLKGSNPPNAKEPQGDKWEDSDAVADTTATTTNVDTTKVLK